MSADAFGIQLFAGAPDGPVRWRMLSGNNREVGRSAGGYPDETACRQALAAEQQTVGALVPRLRRTDPHRWRWELHRDGVPVALAGHSYDRQVRCELALAQFLAHFPCARPRVGVVISGTRRWGSVAL